MEEIHVLSRQRKIIFRQAFDLNSLEVQAYNFLSLELYLEGQQGCLENQALRKEKCQEHHALHFGIE